MYKSLSKGFLVALLAVAASAAAAGGQYQPIPNFTGIGAGFDFRQAINQRFSGAAAIAPQFVGAAFAKLPAEQDGLLLWCKDCQATAPCSAGGAGAWANGARGAWSCAAGPLEQDLNANGHNIVGASSVEAKQPADAQYRELMAPGNGIKVGNGASAPYTVIDESANISGSVNGVINVKAPPYLAKGDCSSDDAAAIQAAINASCATTGGNKPEVYLPATPNSCYKITSPLLINCGLRFQGAGPQQTAIEQNYFGPTLIVQSAETGWKPPLTTSIAQTWQASHSYPNFEDILDSNGNIEVQESGSTCTSGGGSHPTWPTSQPGTVTDGTCTWALATTGGSVSLASGSGGSLDAADPEFFNGAGYGSNNATTEIGNSMDLEYVLNGLSHFTVEMYVEVFANDGGAGNYHLFGIRQGQPTPSNNNGLRIYLAGNNCTQGFDCLRADVDIAGTEQVLGWHSGDLGLSLNKVHHIALTYDGSTVRLFVDGALSDSAPASGNWTIPSYESFMMADTSPGAYPGQDPGGTNRLPAFYDSIRISNTARYTSAFTPPTAKFTNDSNTMFLENFPTGVPTGTIEGTVGVNGGTNGYAPIETSNGAADVNPVYIDNMALADDGIWATWMLNSTIENIWFPSNAGRTCVNLANNDFQDTIRRVFCQVVPRSQTTVGFVFGNQSNNNVYDHIQCDGQYGCVLQYGGSGHYVMPDFTDRGWATYPFAFINAQALLDSPELDVEDSAPNQLAAVYSSNAYAPIIINGGQLTSGASGNAYLAINGGAPFIVNGAMFTFGTPAELLNVLGNPSSPVAIHDAIQPSGLALTNAGKSWWIADSLGGQDLGVKFADLPASVTNGARRYCVDCDPPANPPVACTSAGAKTGAWVNGLNNTWTCVP